MVNVVASLLGILWLPMAQAVWISKAMGSSMFMPPSTRKLTWTNVGAPPTAALPAAGGTSGIIIDNTVSPLIEPGASQVYFSTLSDQPCGTSGTGGCAVQASQSALK